MNRNRSRNRSRRQKRLQKAASDDPEPDDNQNQNQQQGQQQNQNTQGNNNAQGGGNGGQNQNAGNQGVNFSAEQQTWLEKKLNEMFARGAEKGEKTWKEKYEALEAENAKLKAGPDDKKADDKGKGDGEKTYTQADVAALLAKKDEEFNPKLTAAEQKVTALMARDRHAEIVTAAVKAKAIDPEDIAILVGQHIQHDEDGKIVVANEKGQARLNSKGDPMTVEEFVTAFVNSKPHLKQGANTSGAGSNTNNNGNTDTKNMRPVDKIASGLKGR